MGRVKGTGIKNLAKELVARYHGEWSDNFKANKEKLRSLGIKIESKENENRLAGAIVVEYNKSLQPPRPAYRPKEEAEVRRFRRKRRWHRR